MPGTLVLLSGGQDSTTCLLWALAQARKRQLSGPVETVSFAYGQRHSIELQSAKYISAYFNLVHHQLDFSQLFIALNSRSGLIDRAQDISEPSRFNDELPASFVPGRNIFFLTAAAILASWQGFEDIVGGMCETDYSGYPDCRDEFIGSMQESLERGLDVTLRIHTPLMTLSKAETWKLAADLGGLDIITDMTHTCYEGLRDAKHDWGYGCGVCPACKIRVKGYTEALDSGWLS